MVTAVFLRVYVVKSETNEKVSSTSQVERNDERSSTAYHYNMHNDDVIVSSITSSDADVTTSSLNMTSHAPGVLVQQPEDIGDVRTHRLLQVPDPGERWHRASRTQHGLRVASQRRWKQDLEKTRSAVVVISSVFFTLTVVSTLALGIFCRKRNTVFVLQKCEQRDYTAAAADEEEEEDELSTDCDLTTLPTVITHAEVGRRTSQRRRDLNRTSAAPTTPDLSLFCTSQTGKRNRTGSGSMRRDKVLSRAVSEVRSSWVELGPARTLSTTLPVECTDDDIDDDVKYRVTHDVMSPRCDVTSTSGLYDGDARRFRRSTSLDTNVCRFALTHGAALSQPLMSCKEDRVTTRRPGDQHDSHLNSDCSVSSPCREVAAGDVIDAGDTFEQLEPSTPEQSMSICDDSHYETREEQTT